MSFDEAAAVGQRFESARLVHAAWEGLVELDKGVPGRLYVGNSGSDIRVEQVDEVFEPGKPVDVTVVGVDEAQGHFQLRLTNDPEIQGKDVSEFPDLKSGWCEVDEIGDEAWQEKLELQEQERQPQRESERGAKRNPRRSQSERRTMAKRRLKTSEKQQQRLLRATEAHRSGEQRLAVAKALLEKLTTR
jgi:hypothetical protein